MKLLQHSAIAVLSLIAVGAMAEDLPVEKYVASIRSVDQVKTAIRSALTADCGTGSCVNTNASDVCSLVGALDLKLDSLITNTNSQYSPKPDLIISAVDLQLFKLIWKQCRPTSYQYWNYGSVLHVWYEANPRDDAEIRRVLGLVSVTKESKAPPSPPPSAPSPAPNVVALAPLEPDVVIFDENRGKVPLFNDLVRLVRAKGYRCDSISSMRPFVMSRGFTLVCNRFAYKYEIEDKGGIWQVTVQ